MRHFVRIVRYLFCQARSRSLLKEEPVLPMRVCNSCSMVNPMLIVEPRYSKFSTLSSSGLLTMIGDGSPWGITTVFFVLITSANSEQAALNLLSRRCIPLALCETSAALSANKGSRTSTLRTLVLSRRRAKLKSSPSECVWMNTSFSSSWFPKAW